LYCVLYLRKLKIRHMNKKFYPAQVFVFLILTFIPFLSFSQIQGTVFRDVNNDGIRQMGNPTEPGEFGIKIKVYNSSNVLLASVTTNPAGNFTISAALAAAGTEVRLEFILGTGDFASKRINGNRSNIQFITAGASALNIDFAIASKTLSAGNSNPYVATTSYVNGDANGNGGPNNAGQYDNLFVFPYDLSNDGGSARRVANKYLGAVFGLAWQKESRVLLMSAYLKRHCSFGPNGIGAIYQSQISNTGNPANATLLVDVKTIGINVGANPRTGTLPKDASQPNTDDGTFANVGKTGIGGIELSADGRDLYVINMFEKKLHRINIGNPLKTIITAADVTGNWVIPDPLIAGTQWRPMAIKQKNNKFYIGGVVTKETTTAHNILDTANLRGIVYEFDPATNNFTEVLRFPLSHRRGYVNSDYRYEYRNNYWCAWQNSGDISLGGPLRTGLIGATSGGNATGIYYPQPMFSAIEFDIDGAMIMGIRDRFGDQGGYANFFETGNVAGDTYRTLATGEVLRAGKNGSNWVFENAGAVTSNGVTTTTPGVADNNYALSGSFPAMTGTPYGGSYGPGGKYYYYNFNYTLTGVPAPFNTGVTMQNHYLKSNGGLAYLPGYNEVITTAIDPINAAFTNGIIKNTNLGAAAGNMSARMNLITSTSGDPARMGKAAALGEVEILSDAQSMEIGNRVWVDKNFDGIQDADEPGFAGVKVDLRSPGIDKTYNTADDQVWSVTTDANGNYYFDKAIVNDNRRPANWIGVSSTNSGILPGFEYRVEILTAQAVLSSYLLTAIKASYDEIDSEGKYSGSYIYHIINPGGSGAAGSGFENNYNIDFGFKKFSILPVNKLDINAAADNNAVTVNWKTTGELDVDFYEIERSTNGNTFSRAGAANAKGNGSFNYSYTDDVSAVTASFIYYRIKVISKNGVVTYSQTVKITLGNNAKISVMPNPFSSFINIELTAVKKNKAVINIFNTAGQKVYTSSFPIQKGTSVFNINEFGALPKGLYFITITTEERSVKQKLLKQ
jgi:trimeric autotransporter adhesin